MTSGKEHTIRERAYELWVEGGRRDGMSEDNWLRAEREHASNGAAQAESPRPAKAKPAAKAAAPAAKPGGKPAPKPSTGPGDKPRAKNQPGA